MVSVERLLQSGAMQQPARPRVALVSTAEFSHLDEDLPLISEALGRAGVDAVVADWHDDGFDWGGVDLAVIRSTWDYSWQPDAFVAWAERVASLTRLANPVGVVRWNIDKRYVRNLSVVGVPVVPTVVLEPGDEVAIETGGVAPWLGADGELVVKPAVSAGGRDTERYASGQIREARRHAQALLDEGRAVLVQPYLAAIDDEGEIALVYAGDSFSHAFRKGPILRPGSAFVEGLYREEEISPAEPGPAESDVAEATLDAIAGCLGELSRADLLYARVDLAPGPEGPVLLELELTEPSFFCAHAPGSADRIASAIATAARPRA